jgi:hypothetical protein
MQTTPAYLDQAILAIDDVARRFVALVATADPDVRVPATPDWTVREALMHVVTVAPRYAAGPEGRVPGSGRPTSSPR